jgi:two-component system LytT family response regulator
VFVDAEIHAKSDAGQVPRIAIKAKGRVLFVDSVDVVAVKAEGNYVALVHKSGSYLVRETMAAAEQKLTPLGFVRIHRSILVNTTLVRELRRDHTGTYVLRTTDGSEHPVGRAYKDNLKAIARSWLGVEITQKGEDVRGWVV